MRLLLVLLLLALPGLADVKADVEKAAMDYRTAFLKSTKPEEVFPYLSRESLAAVKAKQAQNPQAFTQTWEMAHMMASMDFMPPPAKATPIKEVKITGRKAVFTTGYQGPTSKSTSTTYLVQEGGVWKIDFQMK